jgi:hypothetical protein
MKRVSMIVMILALAVLPPGCGLNDDDDGAGGGDGTSGAVSFSADNATSAVGMFAAIIDPFSQASMASLALVQAAEAAAGSAASLHSPRGLVELGDLGICDSGSSPATWDDRDDDGTLTAGDVLALTLVECDGVTAGSMSLTMDDVGYALTSATVVMEATTEEVEGPTTSTNVIAGRFRLEMNRVPEPAQAICRLLVSDQSDASQWLTLRTNGTTILELGCFNLYFTFDLEGSGFTLSEPFAVFHIPPAGIMSLDSWGLTALSFPDGTTPVAGQARFVARSSATPCGALGVPGNGIDSNDSFLILTASAGGHLTLTGEAANGAPFSLEVNWDEIH